MKTIDFPDWLTEHDSLVLNEWLAENESRPRSEKFMLICEGEAWQLAELKELMFGNRKRQSVQELSRSEFSSRMSTPPRISTWYILSSVPTKKQLSRAFSWLKHPGNNLAIFTSRFDESAFREPDADGIKFNYRVIYCAELA
jgi:hypothetical protein